MSPTPTGLQRADATPAHPLPQDAQDQDAQDARDIAALILAAGRGERMRPLTDTCPKPLLPVRGKPLMQWAMEALARGGFTRQVVNTAWLGQQISDHFGLEPLKKLGVTLSNPEQVTALAPPGRWRLQYSHEGQDFGHALETAGGVARALPLLGDVFWVLAGDVYAPDFTFTSAAVERFMASDALAHLWLVPNPAHNPRGDFGLSATGRALNFGSDDPAPRWTYSTIGLYRAALFAPPWCDLPPGNPQGVAAPLAPLLRRAMDAGRVTAECYTGAWADVGTPERLAQLNR